MSLSISLVSKEPMVYEKTCPTCGHTASYEEEMCYYDTNITHNLGTMADKAGIYHALWKPYCLHPDYDDLLESDYEKECEFEATHIMKAEDIISILEFGLRDLKERPEYFKQFNAKNGWGLYKHFVPFVEEYLEACKNYPESIIITDR